MRGEEGGGEGGGGRRGGGGRGIERANERERRIEGRAIRVDGSRVEGIGGDSKGGKVD